MTYISETAASTASETPTIIPVRLLAVVTAAGCILSLVLTYINAPLADLPKAPLTLVLAQNIWNAAQVGFLLLLLCLWQLGRTWPRIAFTVLCLCSLPIALYVGSPGALICAALMLIACAMGSKAPKLAINVSEAPAKGAVLFAKFAFLAFLCNLGSSMYNFHASLSLWPYWSSIFDAIAGMIGFTATLPEIAEAMYTLGIDSISLPSYVNPGKQASNLGTLVFAHIWTVLPTLYTLYFLAMMKLAKDSPGTLVQQILCLYGIFHFLFLTDFVDYRYGRGYMNDAHHLFHWNEVFAWRIAILLPVYQKLATNMWKEGNGRLGVVLHYLLLVWAVCFFVHEVVLLDIPRFFHWAIGQEYTVIKFFGIRPKEVGYNGALITMVFVYGITALFLRCKRFDATIANR